jgi:glycine betaine transporter
MAQPGQPATSEETRHLGSVFYVSLTLALAFIAVGATFPDRLADRLEGAREVVVDTFGPAYPVTVLLMLAFVMGLAIAPVGRVRLGNERPEFGWVSWVAMLLSAGVGLSFLFWGTAEPLVHLAHPPPGTAEAGSAEAGRVGLRYSLMYWGPHAWAIYAVVAVAVANSSFRHGRPVLISAALHPLLGDRVHGPAGRAIDVLAVFAILFGVATSLGLGTGELNDALGHSFDVPDAFGVKAAIIAGLMTVSTISAMTGLGRGIRMLSLANIALCGGLLCFVLLAGPTGYVVGALGDSVSGFAAHFVPMSFATEGTGDAWAKAWTYFFWAWWISWAPFVGTFIARISKGRTIRSVVIGVVAVPGVISAVWFSVLGGTALQREHTGTLDLTGEAGVSQSVATIEVFGTLPLPAITAVVVFAALALLFITSADSASFMLGSTTSGGSMKPPRPLRLLWSFAAAFAAVLLLGGGVPTLQGAAVVAAAPFTVILLGLCVALLVDLHREPSQASGAHAEGS